MSDLPFTLGNSPQPRRRGRPPGARSRRSLDLAKYIEATFAGATPGQQAAQLAMVTPKDLRDAKRLAKELGMIDIDLPPLMLAMAVKAKQLARAIGCETKEAWLLLQKERADLLPYVHQRRPQAAEDKKAGQVFAFVVPDGEEARGQLPDMSGDADGDGLEFIDQSPAGQDQVG